ncbi:hypothetical protein UFOVP760_81 [uncultured Caudovirales phage]|uniref:Uncharacterized protein n=1 Tax=uncultured Caudovirales phage TaxID=2100421 RepID=A0A6J7XEL9_9CAUD|nr:hypothetical protein UFOVP760_81 [uncultured Caudovirales phage]
MNFKKGDRVEYEGWDYIVLDTINDSDRPDDPFIQIVPIQPYTMYRPASELTLIEK